MRTTDPSTLIQQQLYDTAGGIRTSAQQFIGVHDGVILDTDATNPKLNTQPNTCRVVLPVTVQHPQGGTSGFADYFALGPCSYPGQTPPPDGTKCVVGFVATQPNSDSSIDARVLSFVGWQASSAATDLSPLLLMGA